MNEQTKTKKNRRLWIIGALVLVLIASAFVYLRYINPTADSADIPETETIQSAVVRQGSIVVSATGSGTLIPADETNLAFGASGEVIQVYVQVGEVVEAGQLLAELDNTLEKIAFTEAERSYQELFSPSAILEARQAVYAAQTEVEDARDTLSYLISNYVLTWEEHLAEFQNELEEARAGGDADEIAAAEDNVRVAESNLKSAWYYYQNTYIEETFEVEECTRVGRRQVCTSEVYPPTESQIEEARITYAMAQQTVTDNEAYYQAVSTGEIPEGASGDLVAKLESAQLSLEKAQYNLDATQLYAPVSGTIMEVNVQVGEKPSGTAFSIADLSQYYLEIYLDETDWDKIDVDCEVEIAFDVYPDDIFTGRVTQVDPQLTSDQGLSVIHAIVRLDPESLGSHKLLIGSNATVEVIAGRAENALLVPVEALREISPGEYAVFVLENDEPKLRMVVVGLMDITYAEILSGLEAGERVTTGIVEVQE